MHLPLQRIQSAITPGLAAALSHQGWAVADQVLGSNAALCILDEVRGLQDSMHLNSTHLVKSQGRQLLEKSHIHEAELFDQAVQRRAPLCHKLNSDCTLRTMLSLMLPQLTLDSQATKLQRNAGQQGCFPLHYDSDEQVDARRVTAILYLNPDWRPAHGGQLKLYPLPGPPVVIEPLLDRMVLFSSCRMLHRVLPASTERFCLTVWLSQARRRATPPPPPLSKLLPAQAGLLSTLQLKAWLLRPDLRRHLAKLLYADEWAESIRESHPDTPARGDAIGQHWREVDLIQSALAPHHEQLLGVLEDREAHAATLAGAHVPWF